MGYTQVVARRRSGVLSAALWTSRVLLALAFVAAAQPKLAGTPYMVTMFNSIGVGQWFRYLVGAIEITGAIGLLIPRLSGLAALGLVALMAGATITNVLIGYTVLLPIGFLLVATLLAWGMWPTTRSLVDEFRKGLRLWRSDAGQREP